MSDSADRRWTGTSAPVESLPYPLHDLVGRVALVTGGGRGIGRSVSQSLADRGATVVINCFHSLDRARATAEEIEASGGTAVVLRASVARQDQVDGMIAEIRDRLGRLDVVVNNAADGRLTTPEKTTDDVFRRAFDVNAIGAWRVVMAAAGLLGSGSTVVNLSSVGSQFVAPNYAAVGASKAALESLTRYLAAHLGPRGIRVNAASANLVAADSAAQFFPDLDEMCEVVRWSSPLGRVGEHRDLVGLVTFLTSELSSWVTGQVVTAEGGFSLGTAGLYPPGHLPSAYPLRPTTPAPSAEAGGPPRIAPAPVLRAEPPSADPGPADAADGPAGSADRPDDPYDPDEIVVVGQGLIVPGAASVDEHWRNAMVGAELFIDAPPDRWDPTDFYAEDRAATDKSYQTRSGFITDFQPDDTRVATGPDGEPIHEMTTRWLRHSIVQAMSTTTIPEHDRTALFVGYTPDGSQHLEEATVVEGYAARLGAHLGAEAAAQVREALSDAYPRGTTHLGNPLPHDVGRAAARGLLPPDTDVTMVDTACSSSLYAIDFGARALRNGECDVALCGGAFSLAASGSVLFSKLNGLSVGGVVRSLDASADGVLFSDGAAVVVLKRLGDAVKTGDTILGLIRGIGVSSDGKGKAIYAPASRGQELAIGRAKAAAGWEPQMVDWVIAHSTGTPAGDLAELTSIRDSYACDRPITVTSNKSLIGHTGWAAGAASVIEALVALDRETIPGQYRFRAAPDELGLDGSNLMISSEPRPWPRTPGRPRRVAVSGFGFGGTNAHVLLEELDPDRPVASPAPATAGTHPTSEPGGIGHGAAGPGRDGDNATDLVMVAVAHHYPGADRAALHDWAVSGGRPPDPTWGGHYPVPEPGRFRLPPKMLRTLDRSQLMVLECMTELEHELGKLDDETRRSTGVVLGQLGGTANAGSYSLRTYADAVTARLRARLDPTLAEQVLSVLPQVRIEIEGLVPASNEDSFPGSMPNVTPARISNYFDFGGPSMTVDCGLRSTEAALVVAARYLRDTSATIMIVGGISPNVTPELRPLLAASDSVAGLDPAGEMSEGLTLMAITTRAEAGNRGLPVVASLRFDRLMEPAGSGVTHPRYLGASGAVSILQALERGASVSLDDGGRWRVSIDPAGVATERAADGTDRAPTSGGRPADASTWRSVAVCRPTPHRVATAPVPIDSEPTVYVVGDGPLAARLAARNPAATVLLVDDSSDRPSTDRDGAIVPLVGAAVTEEAVRQALLERHSTSVPRLVAILGVDDAVTPASAATLAVHDVTYAALRVLRSELDGADGFIGFAVTVDRPQRAHADSGLFQGLAKAAALEMPDTTVVCLLTDASEEEVIDQLVEESAGEHQLPIVVRSRDGFRGAYFLEDAPVATEPAGPLLLDDESLVVAVGGARGITAQTLLGVARRIRPRLVLVGSSDLTAWPDELLRADEEVHRRSKSEIIRRQLAGGRSPKEGIRYYDRLSHAREAVATIEQLERLVGPDRVAYYTCNVLDAGSVAAVMASVDDRWGTIDLLIHAAGTYGGSSIDAMSLDQFRSVRDVKVVGYRNLKAATAGNRPRRWCNYGSFIGFSGQIGETSYAAANNFLLAAADHEAASGHEETTLGWPLWDGTGLGEDPLIADFLQRVGFYTHMPIDEGVGHFLAELGRPTFTGSPIFLGARERETFLRFLPAFFDDPDGSDASVDGGAPHHPAVDGAGGAVVSRPRQFYFSERSSLDDGGDGTPERHRFSRVFDLETDAYLMDHLVGQKPTLPGTFVLQLAADVGHVLYPDLTVVGFKDVSFQRFLRIFGHGRPEVKTAIATVVREGPDLVEIAVRIVSDIVAPSGIRLRTDEPHFELSVLLRPQPATSPRWANWDPQRDVAVPDPYHRPNPAAFLSGSFVSTRDTRLHPDGRRATYELRPGSVPFDRFTVPSVLLDGLVRTCVLDIDDQGYQLLAAPAFFRRVDVYHRGNDLELFERFGPIECYSTPPDSDLTDPACPATCTAVSPEGEIVAQVSGMRGVVLGRIHAETGRFLSNEEHQARHLVRST